MHTGVGKNTTRYSSFPTCLSLWLIKHDQLIIQATCDHRAIFTSYDFGWPGSVQDSRVFKNSHLWRQRDEYFEPNEYIIVDKGDFTGTPLI